MFNSTNRQEGKRTQREESCFSIFYLRVTVTCVNSLLFIDSFQLVLDPGKLQARGIDRAFETMRLAVQQLVHAAFFSHELLLLMH